MLVRCMLHGSKASLLASEKKQHYVMQRLEWLDLVWGLNRGQRLGVLNATHSLRYKGWKLWT